LNLLPVGLFISLGHSVEDHHSDFGGSDTALSYLLVVGLEQITEEVPVEELDFAEVGFMLYMLQHPYHGFFHMQVEHLFRPSWPIL
jgi:hypothetical protein